MCVCVCVFYPLVVYGLPRLLNDSRYGLTFGLWTHFRESIISNFVFPLLKALEVI